MEEKSGRSPPVSFDGIVIAVWREKVFENASATVVHLISLEMRIGIAHGIVLYLREITRSCRTSRKSGKKSLRKWRVP